MPTQVQFRRGTTAQNNSFTGAAGEISIDTDKDAFRIHDGTTSGGFEQAKADLTNVSGATNLSLSGITTTNSLSIGSTQVISSGRQLQNIVSLDATTTATIESAVAAAPNDFTSLNISGISTFSGITTHTTSLFGTQASFSGVITATSTGGFVGALTGNVTGDINSSGVSTFISLRSTNINATGVTTSTGGFVGALTGNATGLSGTPNITVGNITSGNINSSGIVTATSGFVGALTGNVTGTATTATNLANAANITAGTINSARLSGSYSIDVTGNLTGNVTGDINSSGVSTFISLRSTNINATGIVTATTFVGALTGTATSTTNIPNLTGDITSINKATTLATVNSNVGTFGSGGAIPSITVNAKGLITGVTTTAVTSGTTITDDTSTNATRYLTFTSATSGSITAANVSSTKLIFNPSSGNLGIGTTNPTSKLDVVGDARITGVITCTDVNSTSDINLKTNIKIIEDPLEKVMQINGVSFDWKENQKPSIGVIAQELEKVLPELVTQGDVKSVNYNGLIGVLIEAIKEQQRQIEELKNTK